MELLHQEISKSFEIICPNCGHVSNAGKDYSIIADARLYNCTQCRRQFSVSHEMFNQAGSRRITGQLLTGLSSTSDANKLSGGETVLVADARRRAEAAKAKKNIGTGQDEQIEKEANPLVQDARRRASLGGSTQQPKIEKGGGHV